MKLPRLFSYLAAFFLLLTLGVAGCNRQDRDSAPSAGEPVAAEVKTSAAYRQYFGTPPVVREGSCMALVGFLPSAREPEKVVPLPLFLFNPEQSQRLLIERLLSVEPEAAALAWVKNPFPEGTALRSLTVESQTARVDLSPHAARYSDRKQLLQMFQALGHSLIQFPEISRVLVTVGETPFPESPGNPYSPDSRDITSPGPPRLIGLAGSWEEGQQNPSEVSVYFDRPVEVREIRLNDASGNMVDGDFFRSIFDMAVVIHPRGGPVLEPGMPLTVHWLAVDPLNREGKGTDTLPLRQLEHP